MQPLYRLVEILHNPIFLYVLDLSNTGLEISLLQGIAFRPRRLTHIMQAANLPYTQLKRYLIRLKKTNLVVERRGRPNGVSYQATSEGLRFLKEYKKVISSLLG